jgi:hypothetical protein
VGPQSIQQVYQYLNVDVKIPQGNSSNSQELLGCERELLEWLQDFPLVSKVYNVLRGVFARRILISVNITLVLHEIFWGCCDQPTKKRG